MSLTRRAAGGTVWSIATGLLARAVGLVGTVVITHYLAPSVLGEVTAATVLAFTAGWISHFGLSQYVIVKGNEDDDSLFHVSVLHLTLGVLALVIVVLLGGHLTGFFNAPNLGKYLPGMAIVVGIKRVGAIPDRLLIRDMRFKLVALATAAGEITYVGLAVGLVVSTNIGGHAIVVANVAQALVTTSIEVWAVGVRWLSPKPWNWTRVREILHFGAPLGIGTILSGASLYWDKLMFSHLFGSHETGMYGLAYSLSDVPGTYVGEHVSVALIPTMVQVAPQDRYHVFCRACGLLALIVLPMAFGLASVADTLVKVLLPADWWGVSDFLVVLAALAIFRPLNLAIGSLLVATERTRMSMLFITLRVGVLFSGMWFLSRYGPIAATAAVGIALSVQSIGLLMVMTGRGFPTARLLAEIRGPLLAGILIPVAVIALRQGFAVWPDRSLLLQLSVEIAGGATVYLIGVSLFARSACIALIDIMRRQLGKGIDTRTDPVIP